MLLSLLAVGFSATMPPPDGLKLSPGCLGSAAYRLSDLPFRSGQTGRPIIEGVVERMMRVPEVRRAIWGPTVRKGELEMDLGELLTYGVPPDPAGKKREVVFQVGEESFDIAPGLRILSLDIDVRKGGGAFELFTACFLAYVQEGRTRLLMRYAGEFQGTSIPARGFLLNGELVLLGAFNQHNQWSGSGVEVWRRTRRSWELKQAFKTPEECWATRLTRRTSTGFRVEMTERLQPKYFDVPHLGPYVTRTTHVAYDGKRLAVSKPLYGQTAANVLERISESLHFKRVAVARSLCESDAVFKKLCTLTTVWSRDTVAGIGNDQNSDARDLAKSLDVITADPKKSKATRSRWEFKMRDGKLLLSSITVETGKDALHYPRP